MHNPMDLTGKRILVTGASSGIGRACAIALSRLGAEVVLTARSEERLRESLGMLDGKANLAVSHDLMDVDNVESLFVKACSDHKLTGLVHAAGVSALVPLAMTTPRLVHDILTLNFTSFLMLARQFAKKKYAGSGCIIGISSVAAGAGQPSMSAYCGSKGALEAVVRSLALELAPKGIRVNSVVPCYIRTPMQDDAAQLLPEEAYQRIVARHPMGLGSPEDVANATAFLLSDAAKFITGTNLAVDGGYLTK